MSGDAGPLVLLELEDFRFLQQLAWTGIVLSPGLAEKEANIVRRLLSKQLLVQRGGKILISDRGRLAVIVPRVHQSETTIAILKADLEGL